MMIVSVNPLIVYYHDGFLRVSLFKYDLNVPDRRAHLTNTEIVKTIMKGMKPGEKWQGMTAADIREF